MENLVSICIPTYNGEKYLQEALDTVRLQTYRNIELIISDDRSQDNTLDICRRFQKEVDFPVIIYNHPPAGIGANWNHCVEKANGEYIKFLFQDDLLDANCVEEMIKPFWQNKKIGLAFCQRHIIYNTNDTEHIAWLKDYEKLHIHWVNLQRVQSGKQLLSTAGLLEYGLNKVGEPVAVMLRKTVFEKVGFFDNTLKQLLDVEYWYRVFAEFDVAFIDSKLVSFRLHSEQTSMINQKKGVSDNLLFLESLYRNCFYYLHPSLKKELFLRFSWIGKVLRFLKKKIMN